MFKEIQATICSDEQDLKSLTVKLNGFRHLIKNIPRDVIGITIRFDS